MALTRPVFDLRCGILTLREKIERRFSHYQLHLLCREHLAEITRENNPGCIVNQLPNDDILFLNGRLLFDSKLLSDLDFSKQRLFTCGGQLVAARLKGSAAIGLSDVCTRAFDSAEFAEVEQLEVDATLISYPWELVNQNSTELNRDFTLLRKGGLLEGEIGSQVSLVNGRGIHIGRGSKIKPGVVLDAENGPIYIGENVTIMPNAVVEGPAFIGGGSLIKIGAKIYGGTSIGEVCKAGGEIEATIMHSYSNKQHDGYLGHAYLGQWVNLGADTNNSDLKNNYGTVKVQVGARQVDSRSMFVGLFMGDHSKSGINTMFNTGTVVGVMSNVYGGGFPPKSIPSYMWGGREGFVEHQLDKALETARRVMKRRSHDMSPVGEVLYRHIYQQTQSERNDVLLKTPDQAAQD